MTPESTAIPVPPDFLENTKGSFISRKGLNLRDGARRCMALRASRYANVSLLEPEEPEGRCREEAGDMDLLDGDFDLFEGDFDRLVGGSSWETGMLTAGSVQAWQLGLELRLGRGALVDTLAASGTEVVELSTPRDGEACRGETVGAETSAVTCEGVFGRLVFATVVETGCGGSARSVEGLLFPKIALVFVPIRFSRDFTIAFACRPLAFGLLDMAA